MIITSKLDKKDCGCHIYHKLCSATHLPKKPTGPQPVSLATIPLVRIVQPLNCQSIVTITPPNIRTDTLVYSSSLHLHGYLRPIMNVTCMYQAISRPRFDARWISTERNWIGQTVTKCHQDITRYNFQREPAIPAQNMTL